MVIRMTQQRLSEDILVGIACCTGIEGLNANPSNVPRTSETLAIA